VAELSCQRVYETLAERGIRFYAGVPDSLLKDFCAYVTDHVPAERHTITANEGSAIALAVGHHLATGETGLVYMQNSGLGNTVNPLTSLADADVYGAPVLLMVGWRGEPGVADEPQHVKMGKVTGRVLEAIGVPHFVLPTDDKEAVAVIDHAIDRTNSSRAPCALLVRKGTFGKYTLQNKRADRYEMTREQAIGVLLDVIEPGCAVVSTTGMPSRELFELREKRGEAHDTDFLTVGSMGHCSQIALGVALGQPGRQVFCIDGDGAVIMHMGGLATVGAAAPRTFKHVVLNNAAHDSVGGQPTVGFDIDLCAIARAAGYRVALRADTPAELSERAGELARCAGPALLEVRIRKGSRPDLGRPTERPADSKRQFMDWLQR
jgi:phosphonopyruvate decarboxylase